MGLGDDIGQLLVGGFEGERPDGRFCRLAREGKIGGAILFRRNLTGGLADARALTDELHQLAPEPLLVAVDQEGGRVARLGAPFPKLPPMRRIGATRDPGVAELAGAVLGAALRVVGFDQNYAPVLDVDTNPDNPVIGDRAFSSDPETVGRLGAAFIAGLQSEGVAACGKHFPGHGDTDLDSHLALPRLPHSLDRLRRVELPPFSQASEAAAMMTAHVVFSALDPDLPATLCAPALSLLRKELGYDGVIVSDDLEMEALSRFGDVPDTAVAALAAGCDQLLVCRHPERLEAAYFAIASAARDGRLDPARLAASAARVRRMKSGYVRTGPPCADLEAALPWQRYRALLDRLGPLGEFGPDPTEPLA